MSPCSSHRIHLTLFVAHGWTMSIELLRRDVQVVLQMTVSRLPTLTSMNLHAFPLVPADRSWLVPRRKELYKQVQFREEDLMRRELSGDDKLGLVELITILLAGLEREHPYL